MNISINTEKTKKTFLISENTYEYYTVTELLEKYIPLAKSWCNKYNNGFYEYDDMLQEIQIVIINAYNTYELHFNVSIGYYLNVCIRNALKTFCSVEKYKKLTSNCCSLDMQCNKENSTSLLHNFIEDTNSVKMFTSIDNKLSIEKMLSELTTVEKEILQDIYLNEETQSYLSNKLNISQAHVSRLKDRGLKKLKQYCITNNFAIPS